MVKKHFNRRKFIRYSAAGVALVASGKNMPGAKHVYQEQNMNFTDSRTASETDVLIVGGGTAGTIAAIQAARAGAKTLFIERGSQLGGTTTTGGVAFPGIFHAWGNPKR